ncbi:bifunctional DNA primase/polymerase [Actinocatenispora thailandica]|uniref:bifunctional DNA primase/polymerase n=1 Tax=Actinocatenispora thailandica TaxID=227318 RepID=UPI0023B273BC|nr:bifunctional DNA primase/polymerase [Actinocatenispora thailandica]
MGWPRRILREALRYAEIGWPVAPGARALGPARRWQWLLNPDAPVPAVRCECGPNCATPAAHPTGPAVTSAAEVRAAWDVNEPPNIVLACGVRFDVIRVGGQVAAESEKILAAWRVAPAIALTATAVVQRLLFVAPGEPVELPAGADYLGRGGWVPAPPSSRGPAGEDRWFWSYETRWRTLPSAADVALAVWLADREVRRFRDGLLPRRSGPLRA